MKSRWIVLVGALFLHGCVSAGRQVPEQLETVRPTVIFQPTPASYILSCMNSLSSIRSKEFNGYFQEAGQQLDQGGGDEEQLRFICLSLNKKANYKQFKQGVSVLEEYITTHPDTREEMSGLKGLVVRLDQAKINRWSSRKKMLDEREEMEAEIATLRAEVDRLTAEHEQDTLRIKELRNQIEQLKNIENIIKNREHGS